MHVSRILAQTLRDLREAVTPASEGDPDAPTAGADP
jgi:hypothetical protein